VCARAREAMVPVAFQRCSVKASVSLLLLVLVAGGGGWMSLGQGIAEMREKVVNGTFKSPLTTPSTSSRSQDLARVFPMADEPAVGTPNGWGGQSLTNMYDGTPSTAGVEPKTSNTEILTACSFFFFFFVFWKVYKETILEANANFVELADDDVTGSAGVLSMQNQSRTSEDHRKIAARLSDSKSKRRSALLANVRNGELNEEEYFHAVNSSFKKPLRCARYCDQLKYTKFDPDCSWQARGGPVSKTSPTPVYKRKTKTAKQDFHDCSVFMSDEEFLELCNAISKVGYAYAPKKSKSKTTRSCAFNRVTLSPQSNFTMLLLSVVLPVAPFLIPGALILAAVVFSSFVFLRIVMLTKAVLQKFLRLTAFMFSLGMFVKDFLFLHCLRLINNLFAVGMLVEKLLIRLSGNRARSLFATHVVRIRDHGSTIFGHRRKCLPILIAKLLFKGHHKDLVQVAFETFWNNEWACSTSGPEEEVLNLTHVSKLLQTFNAHVKIFCAPRVMNVLNGVSLAMRLVLVLDTFGTTQKDSMCMKLTA